MGNVNLKEARQGTSTEEKQGKTEYRILASVLRRWDAWRSEVSNDCSCEQSAEVRFYKNARADETRRYRVTDSALVARLMSEELKSFDLVEVRYSEDGKEVVEMDKLGHLYFEGETT